MGKSSKKNSLASPEEASPDVASGAVELPDAASPEKASPEEASPEKASPEKASSVDVSPDGLSREELLVLHKKTVDSLFRTTNAFSNALGQIAYLQHQLQETTNKRNDLLKMINYYFGDHQ